MVFTMELIYRGGSRTITNCIAVPSVVLLANEQVHSWVAKEGTMEETV